MKKLLALVTILQISFVAYGQNSWQAKIADRETKLPLSNVSAIIQGTSFGAKSDTSGKLIIRNVPNGNQTILIRLVGYEEQRLNISFPISSSPTLVLLSANNEELEQVIISSTRSSRSIADIPTRVEFIAGEELEEKANMKPGDIRMMLSESTGIQTQQTSATSANAAIRIQGLDGRYTQFLRDGFPVYSGAASGLGLLQIAPLDLKQVEVIKGSASTLYGGGAIAGLINLITKTPNVEPELNFHLDGTDALGLSVNGFYSKRNEKIGTTIFAAYQNNSAYDPAGIDLTAIPKSEKFTFNPKLFLYFNDKTKLNFGVNATFEDRIGGDTHFIQGDGDATHSYFEQNKSQRISTQLNLNHHFGEKSQFNFKNSGSFFNRKLSMPGYLFDGRQYASFTEATYLTSGDKAEWIFGVNLLTDRFIENNQLSALRNYNQTTAGLFVQNTFKVNNWLDLEGGMRIDYVNDYGFAFLPRFNTLFKFSSRFTSRLGGGFGYKPPTIFTEESERIQYRGVLPIDKNINILEKSYGANLDFNYKASLFEDKITLNINHLFFFTHLKSPLQLVPIGSNFRFFNVIGNLESKGTETNIKLGYNDFKLFLGYTFTDAHQHQNDIKTANPLTAKHRINAVLMYELEDKWKVGLESYTFSKQLLNDGTNGKSYVITGFMAEKLWERFSLYINFENFLDTRQSQFDTIYTGSLSNPQFKDIYAPLDGFVINGGVKFRL